MQYINYHGIKLIDYLSKSERKNGHLSACGLKRSQFSHVVNHFLSKIDTSDDLISFSVVPYCTQGSFFWYDRYIIYISRLLNILIIVQVCDY